MTYSSSVSRPGIAAGRKPSLYSRRRRPGAVLARAAVYLSAGLAVLVLLSLIVYILVQGVPHLKPSLFAWEYTEENLSMLPAIVNTLILTGLSLLIAVPIGIGSAIYLVEYAKRGNRLVQVVRMTTETLSGIPSIVYGLFGYLLFTMALGWGYSLLGGALTMAIMILPLVMRTTEEALLAVPDAYREGSFGLGAGRLRTVFRLVLPAAAPGILSGVILAVGRVVGETAALLYTTGTATGFSGSLLNGGRTLSVHMYALINEGLHPDEAYATAVVLLILVLLINSASSLAAKKWRKG